MMTKTLSLGALTMSPFIQKSLACILLILCLSSTSRAIEEGERLPQLKYRSIENTVVDLNTEIQNASAVIIYYRGGWCPYCNRQLQALRKVEDEILKKGYQIYAISPDTPDELTKTLEQNDLNYTLLSDSRMAGASALGIAYKVNNTVVKRYKNWGIDLEKSSGQTHHLLPHPAVIVVNTKGIVQYLYVNKDYKVRLSTEDLLEAL